MISKPANFAISLLCPDFSNFRDVNENDILKEWFDFREETYLCYADKQDRENEFKKLSAVLL